MSDAPDTTKPDTTEPSAWPEFVRTWVLPYIKEPTLWPVLIAVLGHVVLLIALDLLAVYRSGDAGAVIMLALMLAGTVYLVQRELRIVGGIAGVSITLVGSWLASVAAAVGAEWSGVL